MKQFRVCFCIASMIGLFGCVTSVFAAELPPKARGLVDEFEKNVAQTRKAFASELQEWRNAVVLELKSVQKQLAEVEKLDEAILVRDVVRSVEAEAGKELTSVGQRERFGKLPKDAQKVLLKLESPGSVEGRMEKAFVEPRVQLLKNLAEMQTSLTKNNMLDEAVAVREWLRANALPAKSGPVIPALARDTRAVEKRLAFDITAGAKTLAEMRSNHSRAHMTPMQALQLEWVAASDRFAVKLKEVMTLHAKADRLDEALAIRTLIDSLAAEKGGAQRIALVRSAKAKLPEEAAKLTDALIEEANEAEELFSSTVWLLLTQRNFCDNCWLSDLRWNAISEREQKHGRE